MYWQCDRARRGLVISAATVFLTIFAGCGTDSSEQSTESTTPSVTERSGPLEIGDVAPDFRLMRLDGSVLSLSELRGKAVIVDFWATWCRPCRIAMPHLQELSEKYAERLVVVGIAMDRQGQPVVAPFVERTQLTFEIVLPDDRVQQDYGGIQYLPTTFLIDPEGRVAAKWVGLAKEGAYEGAIQESLLG